MPQLMPFFWINSTFMVLFILFTLIFLYFYKNMEELKWKSSMEDSVKFNFLW